MLKKIEITVNLKVVIVAIVLKMARPSSARNNVRKKFLDGNVRKNVRKKSSATFSAERNVVSYILSPLPHIVYALVPHHNLSARAETKLLYR